MLSNTTTNYSVPIHLSWCWRSHHDMVMSPSPVSATCAIDAVLRSYLLFKRPGDNQASCAATGANNFLKMPLQIMTRTSYLLLPASPSFCCGCLGYCVRMMRQTAWEAGLERTLLVGCKCLYWRHNRMKGWPTRAVTTKIDRYEDFVR